MDQGEYEIVVGLEVHAQLQTKTKLFCGDPVAYGASPNTQVSPITLGHPGTLLKINRKAIEFAIKMGLACHCEIEKQNYFARKNYFYPDLPKGYQVSQHTTPICKNGYVSIHTGGAEKRIRLNRIHLEEDAGKSLHDASENNTCIDYNRAGTALIEIVTEPDLRGSEEAFAYLTEVRKLVRYLEICDGNMEEGSLRCDANISVRKQGDSKLGTRVEIKNLNSIRHVKRAIEAEGKRLIALLQSGKAIVQQTLSFDAATASSFPIREKEEADDYRYFAEPDLVPFQLGDDLIEGIRQTIPVLQADRIRRYTNEWQLPVYDATVITEERQFADYFENVVLVLNQSPPPLEGGGGRLQGGAKAAANWLLGPVKTWLNDNGKEITEFPVPAQRLAELVCLVDSGKINFSMAGSRLLPLMLENPGKSPGQLATEQQLLQQSDAPAIEQMVDEVLLKLSDKVTEYKKGKKGLLALFVGETIKRSKGKADPKIVNEILLQKLKSE